MCRSIKPLFNFAPPATEAEIRAAALQFVRKLSGMQKPSAANLPAFEQAIEQIAHSARQLLESLQTTAPATSREVEAARARQRHALRFPPPN